MQSAIRRLRQAGVLAAMAMAFEAHATGTRLALHVPSRPSLEADVPQLERAFWICDYLATTQGVEATPYATCGFVTEQLRKRKFGDDLDRLVAWWRLNKAAEYGRLAHEQAR